MRPTARTADQAAPTQNRTGWNQGSGAATRPSSTQDAWENPDASVGTANGAPFFEGTNGDDEAAVAMNADPIGRILGTSRTWTGRPRPNGDVVSALGWRLGATKGARRQDRRRPPPRAGASAEDRIATRDAVARAMMMIRAYRMRGHHHRQSRSARHRARAPIEELDPSSYGFTTPTWTARSFHRQCVLGLEYATIFEIAGDPAPHLLLDHRRRVHAHLRSGRRPGSRSASRDRTRPSPSPEGKRAILQKLVEAEGFEKFSMSNKKFTGTKRFGLDGGEALIPALEQIIKRGGALGVKEIVFGMAAPRPPQRAAAR